LHDPPLDVLVRDILDQEIVPSALRARRRRIGRRPLKSTAISPALARSMVDPRDDQPAAPPPTGTQFRGNKRIDPR
jgi:hypothetical protein